MLIIDNTTAVAHINQMGGTHSELCNAVTRDMLLWCKAHGIWLSAVFIPGKYNVKADWESRHFSDNTEWKLSRDNFELVLNRLPVRPTVDLFASRLNHLLTPYVSWRPDPQAFAVDALTLHWGNFIACIFPPFSLICRVLQKLEEDGAEAIVVVPHWPTQAWYPLLMQLCVSSPVFLCRNRKTLMMPHDPKAVHPLHKTLQLIACHLSANR